MLERVQRRAMKYIYLTIIPHLTNQDYNSFRCCHLCSSYIYELDDVMFLINSLKLPTANFIINQFISFISSNTRFWDHLKLVHPRTTSSLHRHFYFNHIARLWNYLPVINVTLPAHIIKQKIKSYLWEHFTSHFYPDQTCSFHLLCPCYRCSRRSIPTNFNQL